MQIVIFMGKAYHAKFVRTTTGDPGNNTSPIAQPIAKFTGFGQGGMDASIYS